MIRTLIFISIVLVSCKKNTPTTKVGGDQLLSEVGSKSLYMSELEGIVPEGCSPQDSTLLVGAFVEKWTKDNLMMDEAAKNIPKDLDINKLVNDYRSSLILHNYEQMLTEKYLDKKISDAELNQFYASNREQFQLETPIMKCKFIKVPRPTPEYDNLNKWWQGKLPTDKASLNAYASKYASFYNLNDTVWVKLDDIATKLPNGTLTAVNISPKKEFSLKDEGFQYYFRASAVMSKKEIAPLSYIKDEASKFILHKRKLKLVEQKKEELYLRELRNKNVKIFNQ
jgi:hypothetical protein